MLRKIISGFLVFAIFISVFLVPVSAARFPDRDQLMYDGQSVSAWSSWIDANAGVVIEGNNGSKQVWMMADKCMASAGVGSCDSLESLQYAAVRWNGVLNSGVNNVFQMLFVAYFAGAYTPQAEVSWDNDFACYRLREKHTNLWLVNTSGHFPYYCPETPEVVEHIGQWLPEDSIISDQALWHVVIGSDLSAYKENWSDERYPFIAESADGSYFSLVSWKGGVRYVLCDDYGYPYYVPKPKQTAVTTPNNYYTEEGDSYTDESTNIDVNVYDDGSAIVGSIVDVQNGILNVGGEVYYIDDLTYDSSSKTYYVDSHDEYTYNQTTNNYTTNNYRWEIQYNIDYTSVTYIGQTSEYEERYEYYYELPDGRSSADLTAEDLEQLSVVFTDVIQYRRTTDNISQRALYHFDGNVEDSSYWSYAADFDWASGASLTYMDEGTFNGSLYLDETEHDFTITLPGNDAAGDWTLQFRYYQSHTETPIYDSYVKVGDHVVLQLNGASYMTKGDVEYAATSTGTWNEICIIRSEGHLYYYINGVYLSRSIDQQYHSGKITFHFGSEQQTYKKLDELRFTSAAVYIPGIDYVPTVVPYDSNLTLVLPGGGSLADRGLELIPSENNLLAENGLDDWTSLSVVDRLDDDVYAYRYGQGADGHYYADSTGNPTVVYNPEYVSFSAGENGGTLVSFKGTYLSYNYTTNGCLYRQPRNTLYFPICLLDSDDVYRDEGGFGFEHNQYYTLSILFADGTYWACSFYVYLDKAGTDAILGNVYINTTSSFVTQELVLGSVLSDAAGVDPSLLGFALRSSDYSPIEIIHMELVQGTRPEFKITETYSGSSVTSDAGNFIPDEFTQLSTPVTGNLLKEKGLASWSTVGVVDHLNSDITAMQFHNSYQNDNYFLPNTADGIQLFYNSDIVSFSDAGQSVLVDFGSSVPLGKNAWTDYGNSYSHYPEGSLFLPVSRFSGYAGPYSPEGTVYHFVRTYGFSTNTPYTLSVVLADGSSSSATFIVDSSTGSFRLNNDINSVIDFEFCRVGLICDFYYDQPENSQFYNDDYDTVTGIAIHPAAGTTTADILYMELVKGSEPLFETNRVTSLYSSEDLGEGPILAVRTNRPITSYQLGGVRPSYPSEGQIYGMVENNRITSLQQYTGFVWEAVDGRVWIGERWIPYGSFNVKTLQDLYDVIGTTDDFEYIYSESGFWAWFQRAWNQFLQKLDLIIEKLDQLISLSGAASDCQHVYVVEERSPTCSDPGGMVGTCENCGHIVLEELPALGHDWIIIEDVPTEYQFPEHVVCPTCGTNYSITYWYDSEHMHFVCNCECSAEWYLSPDVIYGYTVSECSRCGLIQRVSKEDGSNGLFSALGKFLGDGLKWILDKLALLVDSISGILDVFSDFAQSMKENVGTFPAFLAAGFAVIPAELLDPLWFAVVAVVLVFIYKKLTK